MKFTFYFKVKDGWTTTISITANNFTEALRLFCMDNHMNKIVGLKSCE